jgi:hypothetical protein
MGLEEYEAARRPRKQLPQLVLTRQQREEILIEWGATVNEVRLLCRICQTLSDLVMHLSHAVFSVLLSKIIDSIRANVKAKNQRRRTVSSLDRYDRFEEYMVSTEKQMAFFWYKCTVDAQFCRLLCTANRKALVAGLSAHFCSKSRCESKLKRWLIYPNVIRK